MADTLADLDGRLRAVEAVQELILRILSTTRPLDRLLEQYGATETQELALYRLLDELSNTRERPRESSADFSVLRDADERDFPRATPRSRVHRGRHRHTHTRAPGVSRAARIYDGDGLAGVAGLVFFSGSC